MTKMARLFVVWLQGSYPRPPGQRKVFSLLNLGDHELRRDAGTLPTSGRPFQIFLALTALLNFSQMFHNFVALFVTIFTSA